MKKTEGRRREAGWIRFTFAAFCLLPAAFMAAPAASADGVTLAESVIVYRSAPGTEDLLHLEQAQVRYQVLKHLPMALVRGAPERVRAAANGPNVRSVRGNAALELYLDQSVAATGANRVWTELGVTGRNVVVAVVDSGLNAWHQDLSSGGKVAENLDVRIGSVETAGQGGLLTYAENVGDTDQSGHGTHVASTVAGSGVSSGDGRYAGVAKNASVIGIGGEHLLTFFALGAFDWILNNRERLAIGVVNNSWGASGPFDPDAPINVATRALHDAGITVVFAAGNGGPALNTLNAYSVAPWVIGVGAAKKDRSLADFSSRGVKGDPVYHPTITAPGVQITAARDPSSFIGSVVSSGPAEPYMALSGTSVAAPHVAGVVALLLEANDKLTPSEIKAILTATADAMVGREEHEVGAGFVNALEAVKRARR